MDFISFNVDGWNLCWNLSQICMPGQISKHDPWISGAVCTVADPHEDLAPFSSWGIVKPISHYVGFRFNLWKPPICTWCGATLASKWTVCRNGVGPWQIRHINIQILHLQAYCKINLKPISLFINVFSILFLFSDFFLFLCLQHLLLSWFMLCRIFLLPLAVMSWELVVSKHSI